MAVQMLWNVKLFKDSHPREDVKQFFNDSPEVVVTAVMVTSVCQDGPWHQVPRWEGVD